MKTPTIKELREKTSSKRRGYVYNVIDYLAYYPAKLFLYTPITPNQITLLWIVIQIISALFLISGEYIITLVALLIFQSMFILDCSDGIVARYKKQYSLNGIYLDHLGHYIADPLLLICFSMGVFNQYQSPIYLLFGLIAAISFLLNKAITLNPAWYGEKAQKLKIERSIGKSLLKNQNSILYTIFELFRLEYLFNLMFWGVLLGYANYTLIIYSVFFFLELLRNISIQLINNYRLDR